MHHANCTEVLLAEQIFWLTGSFDHFVVLGLPDAL